MNKDPKPTTEEIQQSIAEHVDSPDPEYPKFWDNIAIYDYKQYGLLQQAILLLEEIQQVKISPDLLKNLETLFSTQQDIALLNNIAERYSISSVELINYLTSLKTTYWNIFSSIFDIDLLDSQDTILFAAKTFIDAMKPKNKIGLFNNTVFFLLTGILSSIDEFQRFIKHNPPRDKFFDLLKENIEKSFKALETLPDDSFSMSLQHIESIQKAIFNLIHILAFSYVVTKIFTQYDLQVNNLLKQFEPELNNRQRKKYSELLLLTNPLKLTIIWILRIIFWERFNLTIFTEVFPDLDMNEHMHVESKLANVLARDRKNDNRFGSIIKHMITLKKQHNNVISSTAKSPLAKPPSSRMQYYKGDRASRMEAYKRDIQTEMDTIQSKETPQNKNINEQSQDPRERLRGKKLVLINQEVISGLEIIDTNIDLQAQLSEKLSLPFESKAAEKVMSAIYNYFRIPDPISTARIIKMFNPFSGVNQFKVYLGGNRIYLCTINDDIHRDYLFILLSGNAHNTSERWLMSREDLLKYLQYIES